MAKDIYEALYEVQKAAPRVQKDSLNPHFGHTYVSLNTLMDTILPILTANEILVIQAPNFAGLVTTLRHVPSGTEVSHQADMPYNDNPQKIGSSITYFRRYGLMSILGLVGDEDDDANAAVPSTTTPVREVVRSGNLDEVFRF